MRNVINISLPSNLTKEVDRGVKDFNFASRSEFFRYLIREWKTDHLLLDLKKSQQEYKEGKAKKLKNVEDLWK